MQVIFSRKKTAVEGLLGVTSCQHYSLTPKKVEKRVSYGSRGSSVYSYLYCKFNYFPLTFANVSLKNFTLNVHSHLTRPEYCTDTNMYR